MGASIRVAAAGGVLLLVLSTCAVFCVVSAESTEQAFNVSQKEVETLSRVGENVDGVDDRHMSSTEDEANSTHEFNGDSDDDGSTVDEQDEDVEASDIDQRSGSLRRFLVEKTKRPRHGDWCWRVHQCRRHHFHKPGCCKRKCVNLYSDTLHCGECGKKCKVGFRCDEGKCKNLRGPKRCGAHAACKRGFTCCKNKSCVNLYSDANHCGKCGKKCKAGFRCDEGKCMKLRGPKRCGVHDACKKGLTCCKNKSCVNLYSDAMHCGKCGKKCKVGFRCDEGQCKKLPGPKRCGVHAKCNKGFTCCENKCVKLHGSDKFNCGRCGRKCGFGAVCCTGECKYIFKDDAENCGGCHKKCKHGVKCTYGICGYN